MPYGHLVRKTLEEPQTASVGKAQKNTGAAEAAPVGLRKVMKIQSSTLLSVSIRQGARRCPYVSYRPPPK